MPDLQELLAKAEKKEADKVRANTPKAFSRGNRPDRWLAKENELLERKTTQSSPEDTRPRGIVEEVTKPLHSFPELEQDKNKLEETSSVHGLSKSNGHDLIKDRVEAIPKSFYEESKPQDIRTVPNIQKANKTSAATESYSSKQVLTHDVSQKLKINTFEFKGFYKMPMEIFGTDLIKALSGEEFKLLLFIAARAYQFDDTGGRVRIAYSIFEKTLNVSSSTVNKSIKKLISLGVLNIVEKNPKFGNVFSVSSTLRYSNQSKSHMNESIGEQNQSISYLDMYLQRQTPDSRRRNLAVFDKLRTSFPGEDNLIIESLQYLLESGDLNGQPVNSPFGLLERSYPDIREHIRKIKESKNVVQQKIHQEEKRQQEEAERAQREIEEVKQRESAFVLAYQSNEEQESVINQILSKQEFARLMPKEIRRTFAITTWYESRGKQKLVDQ